MSKSIEFQKAALSFAAEADQESLFPQKGQKILFEGEEAKVIRVKPFLVIKTKNRVICGALHKLFEYIRK